MIKKWSGHITLALVLITVLAFLFFYHFPFNWDMTFAKNSTQPFGCKRFDALMTSTFKEGYEVHDDVTDEMADTAECIIYAKNRESEYAQRNDHNNLQVIEERAHRLMKFVKNGGTLILSFSEVDDSIAAIYDLKHKEIKNREYSDIVYDSSTPQELINEMKERPLTKNTVVWHGDGTAYKVQPFFTSSKNLSSYVETPKHNVLMSYTNSTDRKYALCYSRKYKKGGQIIYLACPTLLTNYGAEDGENVKLLMRVLQPMAGHKVIRIIGKDEKVHTAQNNDNDRVFDWLLSDRSLRWALYLATLTLVLFVIVSTRRKRRAIPIVTPPKNATLEFARYMGNYFYTNNKRSKLVEMKYDSLMAIIARKYRLEMDTIASGDIAKFLSDLTNLPSPEIEHAIRTARRLKRGSTDITDTAMIDLIHLFEQIKKKVEDE